MILNLDQQFTPLGTFGTVLYKSFTFSGGEPHIKIESAISETDTVTITHRLNSFNDLGLLCLAVDALKRMGIKNINALIPYFPAARQDRVMVTGEPLSVKVYADILNTFGLNKILVFDPHSEVTPALLNNCVVIPNHKFIEKVIHIIGKEVKLISPDGGALKKIYKVSEFLGGVDVVECSKSRDVKTGKLSGFKVYDYDLKNTDCLIVDDICDGGATFIGLAEELKKKHSGNLYLAVSHGIFTNGFGALEKLFAKIFTTDSIKNIDQKSVYQIQLFDGLLS